MKIFMFITTFILTGCYTYDPYTEDKKVSQSTKGATVGAVVGAVAGNQVKGGKHTRRNARIAGAVLGGLIGGQIGNYQDKQEAKLRKELKNSGVSVTRHGNQIVLNMPGHLTFVSGRADVAPYFMDVLDSVALVLKEYDKTSVEIVGHTDSTGGVQNNQILSKQRAESVGSYLAVRGVAKSRFIIMGMGESTPIADNNTKEGRQANRRVEITLIPSSN